MKREKTNRLYTVGACLGITGILLIVFSIDLGTAFAESWLIAQGGSVETSAFDRREQSYTTNFLVMGSILFGLGLATIILGLYKMLDHEE
ncbi:hypothetical protein ACFOGI_06185 [Virgibacillus xinjiangensis]|uniref:Uncharacterized protein n=1 Tax=Virgibacillus xinjiangensis TaxID=393090 RepID=A0ABV7CUJ9_9BACI